MLAELADRSGLTAGLSGLFARQGLRWRRHAPGVTLARAAAAIADGMSNVSEASLFCSSRQMIFARPAARSTLRRAVFALGGELMTPGLDRVLADARARAWQAAGDAPPSLISEGDVSRPPARSPRRRTCSACPAERRWQPIENAEVIACERRQGRFSRQLF